MNTGAVGSAGLVVGALGAPNVAGAAGTRGDHDHDDDHHDGGHGQGKVKTPALFGPLSARAGDLLALPAGFTYTVVAKSGETTMRGGTKTPARPDGTVALAVRGGGYRLIQNHEVSPGYGDSPVVPLIEGTVYDEGAKAGGCTIIDVDRDGNRIREFVGLSGTVGNCAGGKTPWDTWLTCEETEAKAGTDNGTGGTLTKDHGYVFEVVPAQPLQQIPEPIKCWGRAAHEAVVIEPSLRRAYLTEDAGKPNGLFYRWSAPGNRKLGPRLAKRFANPDAGTLEAMAVISPDGDVLPDLSYVTSGEINRPFDVTWKRVPDRHATQTSLRNQFADAEVTRSKKLEGAWGDDEGMYFVSSFAFAADVPADATPHDGQLWYYEYARQTLMLKAYYAYDPKLHEETPDWETTLGRSLDLAFDGPDNVHVSPYGAVILTEDGNTANHALAFIESVGTQAIARNNIVVEQSDQGGNIYSEMTGPCFSPDGKFLFVNVQEPGHVFAIRGPWKKHLR